jgi:hypothetical protein
MADRSHPTSRSALRIKSSKSRRMVDQRPHQPENTIKPVGSRPLKKGDELDKRRREQTRKQKQLDKQQRRVKRAADRLTNPRPADGRDADLAEMIPGPQPGQIII